MAKAIFKSLSGATIFSVIYLLIWVVYHAVDVYLLDHYEVKFGRHGSFQLALFLSAFVCLPISLLTHLLMILIQRQSFRKVNFKQAALIGLYSGTVSAAIPLLFVLLSGDQQTLFSGMLLLVFFFSLFGVPVVATYVFIKRVVLSEDLSPEAPIPHLT